MRTVGSSSTTSTVWPSVARGATCEPFVRRLDGDAPALGHCVARVDAEVQERVLELIAIDECRPQSGGADHFDLDARADGTADQLFQASNEPVDVGRLRIE